MLYGTSQGSFLQHPSQDSLLPVIVNLDAVIVGSHFNPG